MTENYNKTDKELVLTILEGLKNIDFDNDESINKALTMVKNYKDSNHLAYLSRKMHHVEETPPCKNGELALIRAINKKMRGNIPSLDRVSKSVIENW